MKGKYKNPFFLWKPTEDPRGEGLWGIILIVMLILILIAGVLPAIASHCQPPRGGGRRLNGDRAGQSEFAGKLWTAMIKAPGASSRERGFTLLELLIVIAVIAILAALLFPVLNSAQDRARNANCISNLRQWAVAWRIYADENNDTFMTGTAVNWARGAWLLSFTNGYPQKPPLLLCPKATRRRGPGDTEAPTTINDPNAVNYGGPTTAYDFPMNDPVNPNYLLIASYAANCWIYNPDTDNIQGRDASLHWRKYSSAGRPSDTPLFLDSMWRGAGPFENDTPPDFNGEWNGPDQEMQHFAIERHAKGVNLVFFDSSVRYSMAKKLWQFPWHKDWNATNETSAFPDWMN